MPIKEELISAAPSIPDNSGSNAQPSLQFTSGGFTLYLPPTPFSQPPEPATFVLLDDLNDIFYSVDYSAPMLQNTVPWTELNLHLVPDPAIVFPPRQWQFLVNPSAITDAGTNVDPSVRDNLVATGFLVSIRSRSAEPGIFTAVRIGTVHVRKLPPNFMNWGALESLKGAELPAEMKNGLLRYVFNRRSGSERIVNHSYVTPRAVLDGMPRQWHLNGAQLNWELDQRFAGGVRIDANQGWRLFAE